MLNANKRGITLNLKAEKGRALLFEMVKRADVLLENFAPGTMDGLGVGWSVLHPINPRMIYATASGYGISGPNRSDLAMDLTVQAASGIMSVTGFADGPPVRTGVTVADFMGGIHAYGGIMTALFEREHSGIGRLVEVAMQEAVYFTLAGPMEQYRRRGEVPPRSGNGAGGATSPYGVFEVKDGYVAIHTGTDQHWFNILEAAGRTDLTDDPRLQTMHGRNQHIEEVTEVVTHLDRVADQGGDRGAGPPVPHSAEPGARCQRGDARSAHARTRDVGVGRSSRTRPRGAADDAVAGARHRCRAGAAKSVGRAAQR